MSKVEHDYYQAVKDWFLCKKSCQKAAPSYKLRNAELLEVDVAGWKNCSNSFPDYACELKAYPFPVGAAGYGSIGQALAIQKFVPYVYVGCIASDLVDEEDLSWEKVLKKSSIRDLLEVLKIPVGKENFDEYVKIAEQVFSTLFGNLGLGFLIVHEYKIHEYDTQCEVIEIVTAKEKK
jgi:hypothetical protein